MRNFTTFMSCAGFAMLVAGCEETPKQGPVSQPAASIIGIFPARGASPAAYCKLREVGGRKLLRVEFRNSGGLDYAGGAEIRVVFNGNITVPPASMKAIAAGATAPHDFAVPRGCFNSDCGFDISWSNQPSVKGICIG